MYGQLLRCIGGEMFAQLNFPSSLFNACHLDELDDEQIMRDIVLHFYIILYLHIFHASVQNAE